MLFFPSVRALLIQVPAGLGCGAAEVLGEAVAIAAGFPNQAETSQ